MGSAIFCIGNMGIRRPLFFNPDLPAAGIRKPGNLNRARTLQRSGLLVTMGGFFAINYLAGQKFSGNPRTMARQSVISPPDWRDLFAAASGSLCSDNHLARRRSIIACDFDRKPPTSFFRKFCVVEHCLLDNPDLDSC